MQPDDYDEELLAAYPQPLAGTYARFIDQRDPTDQHSTLMALFELLLKYLAAAALGQYLAQGGPHKEIATFLGALRRPSLGHWAGLLRGVLAWRAKQSLPDEDFVFPTFPRLYRERTADLPAACALLARIDGRAPAKTSLSHVFDRIISYRNDEAHGAGSRAEERAEMVLLLQPALEEIMRQVPELAAHELRFIEKVETDAAGAAGLSFLRLMGERPRMRPQRETSEGAPPTAAQAYLALESGFVPLHPLLIYIPSCARCNTPQVGVLNEANDKTAEYLCYACGHEVKLPEMAAQVGEMLSRFGVDLLPASKGAEVPNNLPEQLTSFVGRVRELAEVKRLLGSKHMLTLVGPGGSGKSRLAQQVASDMLYQFPDGVFFVALAPLQDAMHVLPAIVTTLSLQVEGEETPAELLKRTLRDKRMLLLLDNFEHLTGAAPQVAELLAAAPNLSIIATSQTPLRIYGEQEYEVQPLAVLDPARLPPLDVLAQNESVALFVERARAIDPAFALTAQNAEAVAEICARLDGLPLAIELAAARIKLLPPQEMRRRLAQRLKLLTGGARDKMPRQQTMNATIAWSYDLLDTKSSILFRRLSVFAGGCTLEACEQVCNAIGDLQGDVLDELDSLLSKSLLRRSLDPSGEPRFTMLQTIREFAFETFVEGGEVDFTYARYTEYFRKLAEQAEPQLTGAGQETWVKRLQADHDNLRAALTWALDNEDFATALSICAAVVRFWLAGGHLAEGRGWLKRALEQSARVDSVLVAKALNAAACLAISQGDYAAAQTLLAEAFERYSQDGDRRGMVLVLGNQGIAARNQGLTAQAKDYFERGLALRRELGDRTGIARSLNNLGVLAVDGGDLAAAEQLYRESLELLRELGAQEAVARVLNNLGEVAMKQQQYTEAAALFEESLTLRRDLGDKVGVAECLQQLAHLAAAQQSLERAARLWGAEEALREAIGAPLQPVEQPEVQRLQAEARRRLEGPAWSAAWSAGRAMSFEQAVKFASSQEPAQISTEGK